MSSEPTQTPGADPVDPTPAASPAPAAAPTTAAAPVARPATPQYGEYAPEGWEWKPEDHSADPATATGPGAAAGRPASQAARPAGVPHNLGAPSATQSQAGAAPAAPQNPPAAAPAPHQPGEPYRAAAPAPQQQSQLPPAYRTPGPGRPRMGDRVVTIVLLAFGALGALNIAGSFFGLAAQVRLMGDMLGLESPKVADWVGPLGVVSGLIVLLLFALNLIYSIQRMRAGKLAFWVPLAAGAIAFIILMVVPLIAMNGAPEIMQQLESDPTGSLDRMLDYVSEQRLP